VFDHINRMFGPFDLDVCADSENSKCDAYISKEENGLLQKWAHLRCYMNPPYGRAIGDWVKKAFEESLKGAYVVCLLPARTDTKWFHDYCIKGQVYFVKGRIKFGEATASAPFPSMIVVFGEQTGNGQTKTISFK
jgi:phage N-6-adenine-methyltransferase